MQKKSNTLKGTIFKATSTLFLCASLRYTFERMMSLQFDQLAAIDAIGRVSRTVSVVS